MTDYRVKLQIYSGPLDLLLHLVKQHEVAIDEIPVGDVTEQYLAYLDLIQELDLNFAADFLVTAATLMLIKVRSALPVEQMSLDDEDDDADPRMELIRQLMEYKKYRDAADLLKERAHEQAKRVGRQTVPDPEAPTVEEMLQDVSLWDLMKAFREILAATGADHEQVIVVNDSPVSVYMEELQSILLASDARRVRFQEAFAGKRARIELVGMFLAILELARLRRICIVQDEHFGEIEVALTEEGAQPLSDEERRLVEGEGDEAPPLNGAPPEGEGAGPDDAPGAPRDTMVPDDGGPTDEAIRDPETSS